MNLFKSNVLLSLLLGVAPLSSYANEKDVTIYCADISIMDGYSLKNEYDELINVDGTWSKEYIMPGSDHFYYYAYNISEATYDSMKDRCMGKFIPHPNSVEYMGWNIFHVEYDNGDNKPASGYYGIRTKLK
ncbi:hypothetical protein HQQ94_02960 [Shewanella sp. VB17]|uniref:hypothetical protein n=1 Tax=Shewanella sp. VB17 TaxID=2739432 RepID=UPI0015636BD1|nr:hypothetical protein [Shewanella sp. VB17]NRD72213.1 hypothetical protein [Shewanella sp. VB17]